VLVKKATAYQQIRDLVKRNEFEVFVNLCDGAFDEDRAGAEVVQILENFNVPFTGGNSGFYEPSKELMKMMAYYFGVNTPAYAFAYNAEDIEDATKLRFPVIVKHFNGYSSVGMTAKSKCHTPDELREQASAMIKSFGGALIEEFIEGREFSVLVAENPDDEANPYAFTPVEEVFGDGETFKHFDLKWKDFGTIQWRPCSEEKIGQTLKEMSKKMFVALNGVGYGRTDMRVNEKGEVFFLEINPNCGIFYQKVDDPQALGSADFILLNDKEWDHNRFIELILRSAIHQRNKRVKKVEVRFKPSRGYGLYAARDISVGEIIQQGEQKGHYLVTKSHVENTWKDVQLKGWFQQYAYPMTDNTYVMWSEKPEEWLPLNHCCDPNTWLVGLDLVSRRPIKKGEQITMEYATFCTDNMHDFECGCGATNCRRNVKGTDYLQPWLEQLYKGHMSDYVVSKRQQQSPSQ
jgi:D-alanine-D-alanine ligase